MVDNLILYNSVEAGETRSLVLENFSCRLSLSMVYMPACTWYIILSRGREVFILYYFVLAVVMGLRDVN